LIHQHNDPQQDTPAPPQKTQHETNVSAGLSPEDALAGRLILRCMPAGDSKNDPHGKKKHPSLSQGNMMAHAPLR